MTDHPQTVRPSWLVFKFLHTHAPLLIGAPVTIACVCLYGLPIHAIVSGLVMSYLTGLGITMGIHRLFSHRSFETVRPIEWTLMILTGMAGQSSPFFWVATHRRHHRHSDQPGDPHSPRIGDGTKASWWKRFWFAHQGWVNGWVSHDPNLVRDLAKRRDLRFLDATWPFWYYLGLALPALAGYLIGGTAYDALIGFLWSGVLRQVVTQQTTYAVNSISHVWGKQAFNTGDDSRNSWLMGLFTLGDGWHNNHHAHPYSARHGFHWWQTDMTWCLIWMMERAGLAWNVKRPKLSAPKAKEEHDEAPTEPQAAPQVPSVQNV